MILHRHLDARSVLSIFLLALVTYAPVLQLGFLWDDHVMIENNPSLEHWSLQNIRRDFSGDVFNGNGDLYYRPAQTLSNRLDYTVWGLRPFGYHLTNLLVHAATAILLAELVLALGFPLLAALLTGCLFAVHPIGVEQLMIIAGRAELFGLLFTIASLLLWLKEKPLLWLAGTATFAVGLLFKESVIVAPLLGALVFFHQRKRPQVYRRLIPSLIVILPYLWLRYKAVGAGLTIPPLSLAAKFYFEAFPNVLLRYAALLLVPWNLHSHRMMPHLSHYWGLLGALLVVLVATIHWRRHRTGMLCLGWFVIGLLPKTPIMLTGNFMLDHWAYAAAPGFLLALALVFNRCWENHHRRPYRWLAFLLFPLLIGWALLTRLNIELRGTDERMYRWSLRFTESHPVKYNLAVIFLESGRPALAIPLLEDVRNVYPEDLKTLYALAKAYDLMGEKRTARSLLKEILRRDPGYVPAIQTLSTL